MPTSERHSVEGFWRSLYPIFEDVTEARHHDVQLAHAQLLYTGIFDSILFYKCVHLYVPICYIYLKDEPIIFLWTLRTLL